MTGRNPTNTARPEAPAVLRQRPARARRAIDGADPFRRPGPGDATRRAGGTVAGAAAPDYDVVVVGAGPAGSETARRLAGAGHSVLLLEEHLEVGEPVQCAGLIAHNTFDLIDLDPHGDFHQQEVRGGHIVAPSGGRLLLDSGDVHAHAVDRGAFDRALVDRAVRAGAELVRGATFLGSRLGRLDREEPEGPADPHDAKDAHGRGTSPGEVRVVRARVRGSPDEVEVSCRMLVGADGVGSEVARTTGFAEPEHVLSGLEIELEGLDIPDPHNVHVHTGSDIAPGYFAWIVPKGRNGARVGLCVDVHRSRGKSALDYYHEYTRRPDVAKIVEGGHEVKRIVGCIPLGLRGRLVDEGVALVGDAGGFAKPTSGGGIYMASWGAMHLADTIDRALRNETGHAVLPSRALRRYQRRVHRSIGRELAVGAALHRVFRRMRDEELDELITALDDPKVVATINRLGDIDHPSRLVLPLLRLRPKLARYAWPATKELVKGGLGLTRPRVPDEVED